MDFLSQLDWRHANKNFDATQTVDAEKVDQILHAVQMAPSSFGIQPYHVFVVTNPELKKQLRAAGFDQAQFTDASHLLVFCSRTDLEARIDGYFDLASGGDANARENMKAYEEVMRGFVGSMDANFHKAWADRQTYIALGFALAAAAELKVDSCPMEGFNVDQVNQILDLPEHMKSVVIMSVGVSDGTEPRPKVRFPEDDLLTRK